jgi:uridine phosphorylase
MIVETDLILNKDGSIYHLGLLPEQICSNIILVGDQDRVKMFEPKFDRVFFKQRTREFNSLMGEYNGKEILVISTGIGTDNIDIVLNELDALANIDFETRTVNKKHKSLNFYRVGTSGSIQENIDIDTKLVSTHSIGLDALMNFYTKKNSDEENIIQKQVAEVLKKEKITQTPNVSTASPKLLKKFFKEYEKGITVTLPGFYGPQGRSIRALPKSKNLLDKLANLDLGKQRITNLEMETSGIYGMCQLLGHSAISLNAILANRVTSQFSKDPRGIIQELIDDVLDKI